MRTQHKRQTLLILSVAAHCMKTDSHESKFEDICTLQGKRQIIELLMSPKQEINDYIVDKTIVKW